MGLEPASAFAGPTAAASHACGELGLRYDEAMRISLRLALGALGALGVLAACGGKVIEIGADGGFDSSTEDVGPVEDVISHPEEASSEDVVGEDASEDDASEDASEDDTGTGTEGGSGTPEGGSDGSSCMAGSGTVSVGSNGSCSVSLSETCGGTSYSVSCSCPAATCSCTEMSSGTGGGSTGLSYDGCASTCGDSRYAWIACGFPIPP
jgi:hypothetical protein